MTSIQKCIRLPEATVKEIESAAANSGRDFSSVARDLLVEAVKMKNCPGILFADGPTGRRTRVSSINNLDRAIVSFTDAGSFARHGRAQAWDRIQKATYFQTGWGDAYGHCLVATGRVELMLDPIMSVWDCGPFPPILKEAGGYFGDWQGNPTIRGNEAISTTQALLPEVLKLIRG